MDHVHQHNSLNKLSKISLGLSHSKSAILMLTTNSKTSFAHIPPNASTKLVPTLGGLGDTHTQLNNQFHVGHGVTTELQSRQRKTTELTCWFLTFIQIVETVPFGGEQINDMSGQCS